MSAKAGALVLRREREGPELLAFRQPSCAAAWRERHEATGLALPRAWRLIARP